MKASASLSPKGSGEGGGLGGEGSGDEVSFHKLLATTSAA